MKTILYTKRIRGCNECPSVYVHPYSLKHDWCKRIKRKNGIYVSRHRWPKWCPLLKEKI